MYLSECKKFHQIVERVNETRVKRWSKLEIFMIQLRFWKDLGNMEPRTPKLWPWKWIYSKYKQEIKGENEKYLERNEWIADEGGLCFFSVSVSNLDLWVWDSNGWVEWEANSNGFKIWYEGQNGKIRFYIFSEPQRSEISFRTTTVKKTLLKG